MRPHPVRQARRRKRTCDGPRGSAGVAATTAPEVHRARVESVAGETSCKRATDEAAAARHPMGPGHAVNARAGGEGVVTASVVTTRLAASDERCSRRRSRSDCRATGPDRCGRGVCRGAVRRIRHRRRRRSPKNPRRPSESWYPSPMRRSCRKSCASGHRITARHGGVDPRRAHHRERRAGAHRPTDLLRRPREGERQADQVSNRTATAACHRVSQAGR